MPSTDSWQERPLTVVDNTFDKRNDDGWVKAVLDEFYSKLSERDIISSIPSLNDHAIHDLLPNSLVRFRCMIQDSHENEIFLQNCVLTNHNTGQKIWKTSYFRDVIDRPNGFEMEQNPSSFGMRQVLYCVAVPAECEWVKKGWKDACTTKLNRNILTNLQSSKRKRDVNDEIMEIPIAANSTAAEDAEESKKTKLTNESQDVQPGLAFTKNHPLSDESGAVCIVKVYDETANFKINEVYEFYGILSVDPTLSNLYDTSQDGMDVVDMEETKAHHPPASLVPRLHIVAMKQLHHVNPFISSVTSRDFCHVNSMWPSIRNSLLKILEKATFGDSLVAEYILLHLISRVYSRRSLLALGKFSLNIYGICPDSDYPAVLCNFLKELVTKIHYLPMSVENFNSGQFVPTKNYNTNRLDTGMLQLSKGTHLFLDETTLQPGSLTETGIKNFKALKDIMTFQKIDYNFQFGDVSFESDLGVIVVSEGKSVLPCDCQIELKPEIAIPKDTKSYFSSFCSTITSELLDKCRCFITAAKFMEYEIGDDISEAIQADFVAARRQDAEVSADDLHCWLVLARLMSISFGNQNLTKQKWDRVKAVETQRKARVRITPSAQTNGH